ncbi:MAG: dienelactone hydrolase family protein [Rhodospirillaceae bacterium]
MAEKEFDIATPDGVMPTFAAWPDPDEHGPGPYPVVVMYMDAPGIREELYDFARRIAGQGYYAVLPDLYYRLGLIRFDLARRTEKMGEMIFAAWHGLTNAGVASDTGAILAALGDVEAASDGPMGSVGYCMSGAFITTVAGRFPDRFAANVSLYGVWIVTEQEDSPHLLAPRIEGEMYYAFAEHDHWVPDNVIPDLTAALDAAGVPHEIETYPGTEHGFAFPQREVYHEPSAEIVWGKMFDLYARVLG